MGFRGLERISNEISMFRFAMKADSVMLIGNVESVEQNRWISISLFHFIFIKVMTLNTDW